MSTATTRLERYELLDRIAVGGMAEVFRAKASGAHGFEKTLAIKRILPDLARDPEFEQRFINEAKLAVKLSHANIVQVFDFGRFAGSLFIAMEYVEGLDLAALLKVHRNRDEPVNIASGLYIAIEMARGLDFAHQRSVIHRDVSPSNILLSRAGEVKIADFGIAEAVAKRRREGRSTGRIMGKWRYMSPEQTRAEALTISSDVFAAAAVMYEVFTGNKLFPGDEADEIIENIHSMEIPKPSEQRAGLPTRIDEILSRALARDAGSRPDAAEILRELLDISYDSTIVASALGVSEAVASVLGARRDDSGDELGLDGLIRAQLMDSEGRAPTIRKTDIGDPDATQSQQVVKRNVDVDGITILEVDNTLAAGPVAMRGGKRDTSPPPFEDADEALADGDADADPEDDALADPEREQSKALLGADSGETAAVAVVTPTDAPRRSVWPWATAVVAAASIAAGGAWYLAQQSSDRDIEKLPVANQGDGGVAPSRMATLTIQSEPSGAEVFINGVVQSSRTPLEVQLDPATPYKIELRADGYEPIERDLNLRPGQDVLLQPRLTRLRATLDVRSRPAGADVLLDGVRLGKTPFFRSTLVPGVGRKLRLVKDDYRPIEKTIDLEVGRPVIIDERMVSSIVYATVRIAITPSDYGGWANVHLNNSKNAVGRAPGPVRLPIGKQRITLKNNATGVSKRVTINVVDDKARIYRFSLAP